MLASPSHHNQGLSTLLWGNNPLEWGCLEGYQPPDLVALLLSPGSGICAGEEEEIELRRKKKVPQDLQSSADEGYSPCTPVLCQGLVAEPTRLRTLNSKLEEFGTVQGSPSNFASIPQQCLCLLNIFWV